jgi:hypothetical protein
MPQTVEGDRLVVTGRCAGNLFPTTQTAMLLQLEARETKADGAFILAGSVYGRNVRFRGLGIVMGSVLGRGDVTLEAVVGRPQRFLAGIAANGNLVAQPLGTPLMQSPLADVRRVRFVIRGDIIGDAVSLEDAIVFGNIDATRVSLHRTAVFGSVVARERLEVRASSVLTYRADDVVFQGPCMLLHALGESRSLPSLVPYEDVGGRLVPTSLQLYPLVRELPGTSFFNRSFLGVADGVAELSLDYDWVRTTASTGEAAFVLSIMGRALDFRTFERSVRHLYGLLRTGLEFDHYDAKAQAEVKTHWKATATPDEHLMMTLTIGETPGRAAP